MPDPQPTSQIAGLFSAARDKFISAPLIIVPTEIECELGGASQ